MSMRGAVLLAILAVVGGLAMTGVRAEGPSTAGGGYRPVPGWPEVPGRVPFGQVSAVATDSADRVFIFHRGEHPVVVLDRDGRYLRAWGDGLVKKAHGLRIDREDNVWVTDIGDHLVRKFDRDGTLLMTLGRRGVPGDGHERFNQPTDVAVGPPRGVYVSPGYRAAPGGEIDRGRPYAGGSGGEG